MQYVYSRPVVASFSDEGLLGYTFGPLSQDLDVYYIQVEKGHEYFMISKRITRTYYILSGTGYFTIADVRYDVGPGDLVEVPPRVEYCYSGRMTLLGFARPRWFSGNDRFTRWNPDVVGEEFGYLVDRGSRLARLRMFGRSPAHAWLRLNQLLSKAVPSGVIGSRLVRPYGSFLHRLARARGGRGRVFSALLMRNRPLFQLLRRIVERRTEAGTTRACVLGCNIGAEVYSLAWTIRSARPEVRLALTGVDSSREAIEVAVSGQYSLANAKLSGADMFGRMTSDEVKDMFEVSGRNATIRPWVKEGIEWHIGDAGDPQLVNIVGVMDIVLANNVLSDRDSWEAERCLRNIANLVRPGGYLVVSGIDLDVRARVAADLGWKPVAELLEEIHEGDPYMRRLWPFHYGGLEPLDKTKPNWRARYGTVFQLGTAISREDKKCDEDLAGEVCQSL